MADTSFDRSKAKKGLTGAGIGATEADAMLDMTIEVISKNAATKADISDLKKTIERDIARLEVRLVLALFIATGIFIAARGL